MLERVLSWFGLGRDAANQRAEDEMHMSPSERKFVEESVEDRQADGFVQSQLGGQDPERLLEESDD